MRLALTPALVAAAVLPIAVAAGPLAGSAAATTPVTQIKRISPAAGPEYAPVKVTIHGSNFNTTPGETTVSFGATPASSVSCSSTRICTAMSPELGEAVVPVTVTSNGETSTAPITFAYETYAPPVVKIVSRNELPAFETTKLTDRYAAIFDPGNIYLQLENVSASAVSLTGPTGTVELPANETEGYNIPVDEAAPYLFELEAATAKKQLLTVATKSPR